MNSKEKLESFLDNIEGWNYVLNSLPDLITILDTEFRIIWVNKAMAKSLESSPDSCLGVKCFEAVHGTEMHISECPHAKMIADGLEHTEEVIEEKLGGYFLVTASPIKDKEGNILGSVHIARDITKRKEMEDEVKKSLQEKEILIKETHHRVKNNLMVISSLLNLQARYIKDQEAQTIFRESQNRARSMALIHEKLYQTTDLKKIDFGDYIKKLSLELFRTYSNQSANIKLDLEIENYKLDINTSIPLGLIVNELITNSLKHAFPNTLKKPSDIINKIIVKFNKEGEKYILTVSDNGIGLPTDFKIENIDSLGLKLVKSLTDQIHGHIELEGAHGTEFTIIFEDVKFR